MAMKPGIELKQLEKRFGNVTAVNKADLSVPQGAFLVLLGPSGCGKTTILRMLAGLEEPSSGEIIFNDKVVANGDKRLVIPAGERDVGMVFQSYALWPHMTVAANIEWPLKVKRWPAAQRTARVQEVLSLLAIGELANRYPHEISGGQQQRTAIARTIAPKPKILLFDEPLSNLDAKLRGEMRYELSRVHRASKATSVYVTHDQVEAMTMATHVAVMRNGKIEQFGAPQALLSQPATPFVAGFIGTPPANLLPAQVEQGRYCYQQTLLGEAAGRSNGQQLWLMYRAEQLTLHSTPGERRLPVEFAEATPVAGQLIVTVWQRERRLNVVTTQPPDQHPGAPLYLEFPPQPFIVYDNHHEQF